MSYEAIQLYDSDASDSPLGRSDAVAERGRIFLNTF